MKDSIIKNLYPYVRAVLGCPKDGVVEFIGTAFLFKNNNDILMFTAAHVLDCQNEYYQLFIDRPGDGFVKVSGWHKSSKSTEKRRSDDKIDVSVILFDQESSDKLASTPAFAIENFDLCGSTVYENGFLGLGFPVSKNKGNIITNGREAQPYAFHAKESGDSKYHEAGLNREQNILLDFDIKEVYSEENKERHAWGLKGLSGCPVFGIDEKGKCKIVSILIEHNHKDIKAIVTTKISQIINEILANE